MPEIAACTIVAHNYLPLARLLARSFRVHHPEIDFYVVVVDRPVEARQIKDRNLTIIPITDIDFGDEGFSLMATMYDVTEFSTSVKPFALQHLVQRYDCVLYLDPDIKVYSRLDELVEKTLDQGWSLTPHCLQPIVRNGAGPTEKEVMAAGVYNLGYIGVTSDSFPLLSWWGERLRRDSIIDVENQLFTDQRWMDLAVGIFSPYIERSPAYNVAYWNLDQRSMSRSDGIWQVNGSPLRFFHFSGYDPDHPYWMSKYQPELPRVLFSDRPELAPLFEEYGAELREIRSELKSLPSYGWSEAFPGFQLSRGLRRMFRREVMVADKGGGPVPPSPFVPGTLGRFTEWCNEIAPGSVSRLPRFAQAVYEGRYDLQVHFPEVASGDLKRFGEWIYRSGRRECPEFVMFGFDPLVSVQGCDSREKAEPRPVDLGRKMSGLDVVGYLKAELGVGEAGRLVVEALRSVDVEVNTVNCPSTLSRQSHPFSVDEFASHYAIFMAINADQLDPVRHWLGSDFFNGRYVIGQWFWELSKLPDRYHEAFQLLHEVWAPTRFIRDAIADSAPPHVKVVHMQLPVKRPIVDEKLTKQSFGLADKFMFLFTFDFLSVSKRKNVLGLISAFKMAFGPSEGPVLVIKTINGDKRLKALERVRWEIRNRPDIILIDGYFDVVRAGSLMAVSDCFVSLHRSEGLGLTMAEAMSLGKPVIATGYSGNIDFMTNQNSILIPYSLTTVGEGAEGYPVDAEWAEPDLVAAAQEMRDLYLDPDRGHDLGRRAEMDVADRFSLVTTGRAMRDHLDQHVWR